MVDLDRHEVKLAVMSDQGVFDAELEKLFAKTWNFVAHASEIPNPGDFVTRFIGNDPVIVSRQADQTVKILFNSCTHKGALLCRTDKGNANRFRCPYHGFLFASNGDCAAIPMQSDVYPDIDLKQYHLVEARAEMCADLIFGNFDADAPSLKEYLGNYATILEAVFARDNAGMVTVGPPQRWVIHANWKMAAEQFTGDGFHTQAAHAVMLDPHQRASSTRGVDMSFNGHGMRCVDGVDTFGGESAARAKISAQTDEERLLTTPPGGMTLEMVKEFTARATPAQMEMMSRFPPTVGTIFPNCIWLSPEMPSVDQESIVTVRDIKVLRPLSPTESEIWAWVFVDRSATKEHNAASLRSRTLMFSPTGLIERDDMDMWNRIQVASEGAAGRKAVARYRALHEPDEVDMVPGLMTWRGVSRENTAWEFFKKWRDYMNDKPWENAA